MFPFFFQLQDFRNRAALSINCRGISRRLSTSSLPRQPSTRTAVSVRIGSAEDKGARIGPEKELLFRAPRFALPGGVLKKFYTPLCRARLRFVGGRCMHARADRRTRVSRRHADLTLAPAAIFFHVARVGSRVREEVATLSAEDFPPLSRKNTSTKKMNNLSSLRIGVEREGGGGNLLFSEMYVEKRER